MHCINHRRRSLCEMVRSFTLAHARISETEIRGQNNNSVPDDVHSIYSRPFSVRPLAMAPACVRTLCEIHQHRAFTDLQSMLFFLFSCRGRGRIHAVLIWYLYVFICAPFAQLHD